MFSPSKQKRLKRKLKWKFEHHYVHTDWENTLQMKTMSCDQKACTDPKQKLRYDFSAKSKVMSANNPTFTTMLLYVHFYDHVAVAQVVGKRPSHLAHICSHPFCFNWQQPVSAAEQTTAL